MSLRRVIAIEILMTAVGCVLVGALAGIFVADRGASFAAAVAGSVLVARATSAWRRRVSVGR